MKNHLLLTILALMSSTTGLTSLSAGEPALKPSRLDVQVRVEMNYLLYLPPDYEQQKACPLLMFLHGGGERGNDLNKLKSNGPPKLIAEGRQFPFIVVAPQFAEDKFWWEPVHLTALLDDVIARYKVDTDRICVTGLSTGGYGCWGLAAHIPDRLAAIVPICGGGEPYWTKKLSHLPVWAFHGAKDPTVPVERSIAMDEAMKKNGGHPKLTIYPEAGHNAWTETYNNPELYEWLLAQRRTDRKKE
ncbi:MAG TPA: prolyl oligopeptidase family serine peptidase [Planctomycetaceae bacterium]|nr:prolyl oligopeptidase family serine peptidase [Planctomycetaceae bacterium]